MVSSRCTGKRMVHRRSASARETAWRIHQGRVGAELVAAPARSNFSTARMRPMLPSCTRSRRCRPRFLKRFGDGDHEAEVRLDELRLGALELAVAVAHFALDGAELCARDAEELLGRSAALPYFAGRLADDAVELEHELLDGALAQVDAVDHRDEVGERRVAIADLVSVVDGIRLSKRTVEQLVLEFHRVVRKATGEEGQGRGSTEKLLASRAQSRAVEAKCATASASPSAPRPSWSRPTSASWCRSRRSTRTAACSSSTSSRRATSAS